MKPESRSDKCKRYCRLFLTFIFSHIGLCGLVVGYTIIGAFAFQALESKWELEQRKIIQSKRNDIVKNLWDLTLEYDVLYEQNWTASATHRLREYELELVTAIRSEGYDGKDSSVKELQWSFSGALLYTVTVITTIGYGNISPKTNYGKLVTIIYAAIGIPLMLLCLANIGDALAKAFKFFYANICCILCRRTRSRKRLKELPRVTEIFIENPPQSKHNTDSRQKSAAEINKNKTGKKNSNKESTKAQERTIASQSPENITIPISMCLLILVGYIFGGAILFSVWENWDMLDGAYFCFITLSTVGFGDLVPGTDIFSTDAQEKLILCSLYLLFGMALLAMCFNLMQEEVIARCRWIGKKIGVIEEEE